MKMDNIIYIWKDNEFTNNQGNAVEIKYHSFYPYSDKNVKDFQVLL